MPNIGPTELIIILVIVLIIFGVGRLPEIGGAIGRSIREFREASKEPAGEKPKEEAAQEQPKS
ncbi:MAG: twin-arginine translocase TatA/TatE family subunit [Anaerolineae bacterium]